MFILQVSNWDVNLPTIFTPPNLTSENFVHTVFLDHSLSVRSVYSYYEQCDTILMAY
jgi:hypothetical protein